MGSIGLICFIAVVGDDTAYLQAMVNRGGVVQLRATTYVVDHVSITKNDTVIQGVPGTVLKHKDSGHPHMLRVEPGVQGTVLRSLTLDGNEGSQPRNAYSTCLRTTHSDKILIEDCSFFRGGDRAIDIRAGKQIWIKNCRFYDCGTANPDGNGGNAISVDRHGDVSPESVFVTGCYFERFGDTAIGVPACKNVTISNNVILGDPSGGIETESGISFNGSLVGTCNGNVVKDCRAGGIFLWDRTGQPIQNIAVTGNTLVNSQISCRFMLEDSCGITITGNALQAGQIGVMGNGGSGLVISGNTMNGLGIRVTGSGHLGHVITGNTIHAVRPIEIQGLVQPGVVSQNFERPIEVSIK